jgi:two-component system nitrogen regulation sensor histidine kinase GlnL
VIVLGPAGEVVRWNPAAEELLKVSASNALGRSFDQVLPQAQALAGLVRRALAAGRAHADFEAALLRPDGGRITVSAVASILTGAGGEPRGAVLALRDVSRLRELEEKLQRSDRLAALGQMAAGMAHEVRNPLVGIRAAAQFLEGDSAFSAGLREYTGVIVREVDRLNAIVEDLLAFASPKPVQLAPCNLNQALEEALGLEATRLAAARVSVTRLYDPGLPPVLGDPPRLHQVFLNLLRNAAEAMPGGGALTVRTRFERLSARLGGRSAAVAEVADTGPGIPPDRQAHLFNPFFTTKPRGTGLGLAISLRIVEDHGGAIEVEAGAGRGATFAVILPLAPAAGEGPDA